MGCSGTDGLTEQDFMQALWNRQRGGCCGPLISFNIPSSTVAEMVAALDAFNASHILAKADRGNGDYAQCAAHWYDVCYIVKGAANAYQHPPWKSLQNSLFILTSNAAGWDWRDMQNRWTTYFRAKATEINR